MGHPFPGNEPYGQGPYTPPPGYPPAPPPQPGYPAQPYPGQPYPNQPYPGQPYPAGAYPPPGPASQPGWGPPPGPPRRRARKGLWITLSVLALLLAGCCGGGFWLAKPFIDTADTTVSAPTRVAGMERVSDPEAETLTAELSAAIESHPGVQSSAAGFYAPAGDRERGLLAIAAAGVFIAPETEISAVFGAVAAAGVRVEDVRDYDAGELGGTVRCGTADASGKPVTLCMWGDHGSLGLGMFYNRQVAEAAKLFLTARTDMVSRG